jgi:hypothetical protein
MGMVQVSVQRCRYQHGVATEGLFSFPEAQILRQDDRARLMPFCYDLEEQIRLGLAEREIADLVDNQQPQTKAVSDAFCTSARSCCAGNA